MYGNNNHWKIYYKLLKKEKDGGSCKKNALLKIKYIDLNFGITVVFTWMGVWGWVLRRRKCKDKNTDEIRRLVGYF